MRETDEQSKAKQHEKKQHDYCADKVEDVLDIEINSQASRRARELAGVVKRVENPKSSIRI